MSDTDLPTPRVDAALLRYPDGTLAKFGEAGAIVSADTARAIERECAQLRALLVALTEAADRTDEDLAVPDAAIAAARQWLADHPTQS